VTRVEDVKTLQESDALAKKMLGEWAYAHDRVGDRFSSQSLPRYYVGTGSDLYGNGDTWQAAFEAAVKMAARS